MSPADWAVLLVAVLGTVLLVRAQRRHVAAVHRDRAALFEEALADADPILDDARTEPRGLDFPVLTGSYQGRPVRIEPIVDTLSLRIVPVLRLVVTLRDPLPGQQRLSVLGDETGQEFYAGHRDLLRLRDERWPARISVAAASTDVRPAQVDAVVALMDEQPELKQVLLTDRGVRCVVRAAQSDVTTYRVTRRADLSGVRVPADLLRETLRTARGLSHQAVQAP